MSRSVTRRAVALLVLVFVAGSCGGSGSGSTPGTPSSAKPTAADAAAFLAKVNDDILRIGTQASQASWVYSTYITQDTEALNAKANQVFIEAAKGLAKEAAKYDGLIAKATRTPNTAKRTKLDQQAEDILTGPKGALPVMPIYWYTFTALVKNNVKGFFINPSSQTDYTKIRLS